MKGSKARTAASRTKTPDNRKQAVSKQDMAYISINSRPWANVYINGKLIKATPLIKYSLPAGKYKIQFKNSKFNIDKTFPIELKSGEHQRMIKNFN
jgi:hypothetical protein